jgi:hypothetical protein
MIMGYFGVVASVLSRDAFNRIDEINEQSIETVKQVEIPMEREIGVE